jgi:EAL domain-containing protein (putative c-di-GMP-specific phosphodiesterase class I)/GGDEF domain-containing protein
LISPSSSFEAPSGWSAVEACAQPLLKAASPHESLALLQVHFRQLLPLIAAHGQALAEAALHDAEARIVGALRANDHLLRSGHGDFYVFLPKLLGLGHAELAAQRFIRELAVPVVVGGRHLHLMPTVGAALASEPGESPHSLQQRASAAVVQALRDGRDIAIAREYTEDTMVTELRDALSRNALDLVYQPIVTLPERRIVGYEALARWRRGDGNVVAPSVFIPMAEDAGLATELTRWTLQVALREFVPMHRRHPELYCAINLSARAFDSPALGEQILAALAIWGLPASALMIEVTETAVLHDVGRNAASLRQLADSGVRLAIDDFGQGYSSLGYLRHLPAAILKIDQSFVSDSSSPRTRALLEAITGMAHRLGMRVVAEGVETEEMLGAVLEAGSDFAQGYLFARPCDIGHWLDAPPFAQASGRM